jgi:hypothetical protein
MIASWLVVIEYKLHMPEPSGRLATVSILVGKRL